MSFLTGTDWPLPEHIIQSAEALRHTSDQATPRKFLATASTLDFIALGNFARGWQMRRSRVKPWPRA